MVVIYSFATALLLGKAVFAAPGNILPNNAALAADALLAPTPAPTPAPELDDALELPHLDMRAAQIDQTSVTDSSSSSSSVSTTASSSDSSITSSASTNSTSGTSSANSTEYVGSFTGGDGNVYGVTSISGEVIIDGHTLTAGGPAPLIGQVQVTDGAFGLLANGQAVFLTPVTSTSSSVASTTMAASTTSGAGTTLSGTRAASDSSTASAASTTSSKGAAATGAVAPIGAVMGGLMGLLLL